MELSPKSRAALNEWLNHSQWHSDYPEATQRFYAFIDAYQKEHGNHVQERALCQLIREHFLNSERSLTGSLLREIERRARFMRGVLEFLEQTKR